jgi:ABC-type transport system involved in multi-copper enzyme maturation permease subunit
VSEAEAASLLTCVRAQVAAEVRTRLRSPGTVVAVLAILVASFLWIPDPASGAVSISWTTQQGQRQTGLYTSAYVGTAAASLAGVFLSLIGFYLVAGSVRRDRESGVGAILAATPLSRTAYLAGKLAAHTVYLHAVGLAALASGVIVFLRYGTGPFIAWQFLVPFAAFVPASLAFTAGVALFFDTTPGLRGRGGPVVYFFAWSFGLVILPLALQGGVERTARYQGPIVFDPTGMATLMAQIESQADVKPGTASVGIEYSDTPTQRVEWQSRYLNTRFLLTRLLSLGWSLAPLALSVWFFDRFDPARTRQASRRRGLLARFRSRATDSAQPTSADDGASRRTHLDSVPTAPSLWGAVAAEARLVWLTASWLRWPLLAAALGAAVLPGDATRVGLAAFLLLLAPILSEVAAREDLAGTRGLVQSQPGVPRSMVLWKAGAVLLFVLGLGLPATLRAAAEAPARGLAMATGLAFVAALSVACGATSGGGKLFTGLYTALWYLAVNGAGALDYCGAFGGGLGIATRVTYLAAGVTMLAFAWGVERWRAA